MPDEDDAIPGTSSKCKCDHGFNVAIPVPPCSKLTRVGRSRAYGPGDTLSYTIVYGILLWPTSDKCCGLGSTGFRPETCQHWVPHNGGASPTSYPGDYGQLVTCTVPGPMNPGDPDRSLQSRLRSIPMPTSYRLFPTRLC